MKVLISGASGLIGSTISKALSLKGDQIFRLVRAPSYQTRSTDVIWHPMTGEIDVTQLEGFDVVIHLAGDNLASGRWTTVKKQKIKLSRTEATKNLSVHLSKLHRPPKIFLCASAIGFYGNRGDELLDEKSTKGEGFLPDVVSEWEIATQPARDKKIRTVNLRFGVVLSPLGGALQKMLFPFKLGLGGRLGEGHQYMSWIDLSDIVDVVRYTIRQDALEGPINVVTPNPVSNLEFTKTLGKVLNRPTVFPVPAFVLKMLLGEMAQDMLLSSTRVSPRLLLDNGFRFRFPDLDSSLRHLLAR